jgi:hypothetical protein
VVASSPQPINATATFYLGIEITTPDSLSVAFSYPLSQGAVSFGSPLVEEGTVVPGTTAEVYVPPSSNLTLKATPTLFVYTFAGWLGMGTSSGTLVLVASSPTSLTAESGLNLPNIAFLALALVLLACLAVLMVARRRRPNASTEQQVGPSANNAPNSPEPPMTKGSGEAQPG